MSTLVSVSAFAQTTPDADPPYETNDPEATPPTTTMPDQDPPYEANDPEATPVPTVVVEPPAPAVIEPAPPAVLVVEPKRERHMTLLVGGGVSDFTDSTMRDRTGLNGAYEARLSIGINSPLAIEAAYVGTASEIDTLGLDDQAMLVSNGVEGLARLNLGTFDVQPYVVGGASWVRYNVVNDDFNSSDVRDQDDALAVPLGAGLSTYLGDSGLVLDGRFTYRMMFDDELVRPTSGNSDGSGLDNWIVTAKLGYAF
jgi:hypothetical protein